MKTCTKCLVIQEDCEFQAKRAQCKTCRGQYMQTYLKEYSPKYYKANKSEINQKGTRINRRKRHERYGRIAEIKAAPCVDCNKTFPPYVMDFDHRDPEIKVADVSDMVKRMFRWESVLEEIAKCDLLCVCCHRMRTYKGDKSYRTKRFQHHRLILNELKQKTPCADCGESFQPCQMDFDHVLHKTMNISQLVGSSLEQLQTELSRCHLVCANCHRVRSRTGVRPTSTSVDLVSIFRALAETVDYPTDRREAPFPFPELLGKVPDKQLADRAGISIAMVAWHRRKAGILLTKSGKIREAEAS